VNRRPLVRAAEVGLLSITLAAVVGMHRLFATGGWLGPLAAHAVAAHLLASLLRRRGLSLPVSAGIMAIAAGLVASWTSYWSTTTLGLPTGTTWTRMQDDLSTAWSVYQDVVAPAPVKTGFVLASAAAIWCIAFVADWAAFRLWVPFESTLPAGTLFLFTALLGADNGRGVAAGLYAAALLAFLLLHRVARQEVSSHWVSERRSDGRRSMLVAGGVLGAMAVVVGTVVGPNLPGANAPGVLDPRELSDKNQARVTISPLVDIRSRLVDQANVEVFTVRASQRAYWRLTSLERFDGRIWSSSGSYGKAGGNLPEAVHTDIATAEIDQTYTISALSAIWLPSAFEARAFKGSGDVEARYDEDSATLIVDNSVPTSDGLTYDVTSASPRLDAATLEGDAAAAPGSIAKRFTGLPADFSPRVRQLAVDLTAGKATPYDRALALQDHLRTFTYDLTVNAGHSDDVLEQFLFDTKRGYCEQFAGAFAAMARAIGLPSRVAVGFTPGDADPNDPGLFRVRGEHAHAWPEVFISGAGWVAFEPTPGRGIPFAEPYTGVPEAQAATGQPNTATTVDPTTAGTAPAPGGPTPQPDPGAGVDTKGQDTASGGGASESLIQRFAAEPAGRAFPWALGVVLAYLAGCPALLVLVRRLRRQRATTAQDQIGLAWIEASEEASLLGYASAPSETYDERSRHLAAVVPDAGTEAVLLARLVETAHYTPEGPAPDDVERAWGASTAVRDAVRRVAPLRARVRRWLDPRPPLRMWRRDRAAAQRRITTSPTGDREVERRLVSVGGPDLDADDDLG
jgi:transglutaminase-like putative cysteine protease